MALPVGSAPAARRDGVIQGDRMIGHQFVLAVVTETLTVSAMIFVMLPLSLPQYAVTWVAFIVGTHFSSLIRRGNRVPHARSPCQFHMSVPPASSPCQFPMSSLVLLESLGPGVSCSDSGRRTGRNDRAPHRRMHIRMHIRSDHELFWLLLRHPAIRLEHPRTVAPCGLPTRSDCPF